MGIIKAALYLRQSQDRDNDEMGVERQREACLDLCRRRGWEPVEFIDNDTSATRRKRRPAFEQMMTAVDDGDIQVIVAKHMDRLLRRLSELEGIIARCEARDVHIVTAADGVDTSTDGGRTVARIMSSIAQGEMERKSSRQKDAAKQAAANGKPHGGGTRAFGYTKKLDRKAVEARGHTWNPATDASDDQHVDAEVDAVRDGYAGLLGGESLYSIAKRWNADGHTSTRGNAWSGETVRQVLINPRYAGLRFHLGVEAAEAQWKPVVARDVWEAAVDVLSDPKRFTGRSPGRKHLLTGIACCGECGHTMGTGVSTGRKPTYVCKSCFGVTRQLALTDAVVIDAVTSRLAMPDAAQALAAPTVDVAALRDRASALRDLIKAAEREYDEGLVDARRLNARLDTVGKKLAAVDAEMVGANTANTLGDLPGRADAAQRFAALPLDRQRAVIDRMCVPTIRKALRGTRFDPRMIDVEFRQ